MGHNGLKNRGKILYQRCLARAGTTKGLEALCLSKVQEKEPSGSSACGVSVSGRSRQGKGGKIWVKRVVRLDKGWYFGEKNDWQDRNGPLL